MNLRRIAIFIITIALSAAKISAQDSSGKPASLPANTKTLQRIAFGSCAKHWQHQSIWESVIAQQPDLYLSLGDAIYSDTDGVTAWAVSEKQLQGEWNRLADKPEFQQFRSAIPMMAVWDNHDYGTHNGGAEFELKEASKKIFLDFFGEPPDSKRRKRPGIYDAKLFGPPGQRVQIILLDTRTFRGPFKRDPRTKAERAKIGKVGSYLPRNDTDVGVLGADQWAWLEQQLKRPAELRLVCSSTQIIPDQKGMDEWGCFPSERQRLFTMIESTNAKGVVLLSGNVHFAEISQVKFDSFALIEFTSSGLTHTNKKYAKAANKYRVAGPVTKLHFGLVEIDWSAKPSTQVTLKAISIDGSAEFTERLFLK